MRYVVLDTETTNGLEDPLVYDIGWIIMDEAGKILQRKSFVVKEIFFDNELMECAFFKDKIPQYLADIEKGTRKVASFLEVKKILANDARGCKAIVAHNARFDYSACQNTVRYLTKSAMRYFLPFGVEIWDSLKMAREVYGDNKAYTRYCEEKGFLTENQKKPKMTAEVLYRFLIGDDTFIESHTGLEDTLIEGRIFMDCLNKGAKDKALFNSRFIEIFNGRDSYFVECRGNVIGAEYFAFDDIPFDKFVIYNNGTFFKKELEIF